MNKITIELAYNLSLKLDNNASLVEKLSNVKANSHLKKIYTLAQNFIKYFIALMKLYEN